MGPRTAWGGASIALVAVVVAAGCGGGVGGAAVGAAPATHTTPSTANPGPHVDPVVARWARKWKRRIAEPMRRAAAILAANAQAAAAGDAGASFRLTPALNVLSNCRNPLDLGLAQPPKALIRARAVTIAACRAFYVGTDTVVDGLNAQSVTTARAGAGRVRRGLTLLRRAGHLVKRAARPQ